MDEVRARHGEALVVLCSHHFYAQDNIRNKPCHTSEGPPFIHGAATWKLLLSQTTVFVKCDRENQATISEMK